MGTRENSGWDGRRLATLFHHRLFKSILCALPSNSAQTLATPLHPPHLPMLPPHLPWVITISIYWPSTSINHLPLCSILNTGAGVVLLEITSLYSSGPNKGSHFTKSYKALYDLAPVTSNLNVLPSSVRQPHWPPPHFSHTPNIHLPEGLCTCCALCLVHPSFQIAVQLDLYLLRSWLT